MEEAEEIIAGAVPESSAGDRLDKVLPEVFPPYSRSQLQVWLKEGRILLNNSVPHDRLPVRGGEILTLDLPVVEPSSWVPQPVPLSVVFEDDHVVVIDKPAGLVVHPGAGNSTGTLANGILHRYPQTAQLPRAGVVHRLDKDTSGLLVVALTEAARGALIRALEHRDVQREYLSVVNGTPISGGRVDAPIGRHPRDRIKMAVTDQGKPALTDYRILERFHAHTYLALKLHSGRTHQIRVHMAHLGFPLVGDPIYGDRVRFPSGASANVMETLSAFRRQALHATMLGFTHPVTGELLSWVSPPPADFDGLLTVLRRDSGVQK
ncbi:MAG: 23S rRNA pseudouridine(1911/1915/1917) synthase RluD [Arenicellales bacterium]